MLGFFPGPMPCQLVEAFLWCLAACEHRHPRPFRYVALVCIVVTTLFGSQFFKTTPLPACLALRCDRVLVLRGGRLLANGTWGQVVALQLPELTAGHGGGDGGAAGAAAAAHADVAEEDGPTVDEALDEMGANPTASDAVPEGHNKQQQQQPVGSAAAAGAETATSGSSANVSDDIAVELCGAGNECAGGGGAAAGGPAPRAPTPLALPADVGHVLVTTDGEPPAPAADAGAAGSPRRIDSSAGGAVASRFWRVKSVGPSAAADRYRLSLTRVFAAGGVSMRFGSLVRRPEGTAGGGGAGGGSTSVANSKSVTLQRLPTGEEVDGVLWGKVCVCFEVLSREKETGGEEGGG
jgi:hypothetical protein